MYCSSGDFFPLFVFVFLFVLFVARLYVRLGISYPRVCLSVILHEIFIGRKWNIPHDLILIPKVPWREYWSIVIIYGKEERKHYTVKPSFCFCREADIRYL